MQKNAKYTDESIQIQNIWHTKFLIIKKLLPKFETRYKILLKVYANFIPCFNKNHENWIKISQFEKKTLAKIGLYLKSFFFLSLQLFNILQSFNLHHKYLNSNASSTETFSVADANIFLHNSQFSVSEWSFEILTSIAFYLESSN